MFALANFTPFFFGSQQNSKKRRKFKKSVRNKEISCSFPHTPPLDHFFIIILATPLPFFFLSFVLFFFWFFFSSIPTSFQKKTVTKKLGSKLYSYRLLLVYTNIIFFRFPTKKTKNGNTDAKVICRFFSHCLFSPLLLPPLSTPPFFSFL